jgi:RNA binding exosome subunit
MFAWLELRAHCHATEDEEKVARAMELLCPQAKRTISRTEGYHGNPILVMTARTDSSKAIRRFWLLMQKEGLVDAILNLGDKIVDDGGVLHLRMGKQEAYLGRAVLANEEDVVAVRLKVPRIPSKKASVFETAKETIMELTRDHVSRT